MGGVKFTTQFANRGHFVVIVERWAQPSTGMIKIMTFMFVLGYFMNLPCRGLKVIHLMVYVRVPYNGLQFYLKIETCMSDRNKICTMRFAFVHWLKFCNPADGRSLRNYRKIKTKWPLRIKAYKSIGIIYNGSRYTGMAQSLLRWLLFGWWKTLPTKYGDNCIKVFRLYRISYTWRSGVASVELPPIKSYSLARVVRSQVRQLYPCSIIQRCAAAITINACAQIAVCSTSREPSVAWADSCVWRWTRAHETRKSEDTYYTVSLL